MALCILYPSAGGYQQQQKIRTAAVQQSRRLYILFCVAKSGWFGVPRWKRNKPKMASYPCSNGKSISWACPGIYIYIQRIYLHRHKRCSHSHLRVILPRSPTCVATFKHGLRHGYGCTDFFCEKDSSLEELRTPHPQPTPEYKDHLHTNIQSQRLYLET